MRLVVVLVLGAVIVFSGAARADTNRSAERTTEHASSSQQNPSYGGVTVEVFMTSWCGYCKKMVAFLKEKGIPYTAFDIEKDSAAAQTYRKLGGRGVPVVRVGSHVVYGYNPEGVMAYLNAVN